jgi:hypothetical protein
VVREEFFRGVWRFLVDLELGRIEQFALIHAFDKFHQ